MKRKKKITKKQVIKVAAGTLAVTAAAVVGVKLYKYEQICKIGKECGTPRKDIVEHTEGALRHLAIEYNACCDYLRGVETPIILPSADGNGKIEFHPTKVIEAN